MDKPLSVATLRTALDKLEDTDEVIVNGVGNLAILREGEYVGFIDFLHGKVQMNDDEDGEDESKEAKA